MKQIPKPHAFSIYFLVTFLLADSLFDVSWVLSLFYIHYYVGILKQEN